MSELQNENPWRSCQKEMPEESMEVKRNIAGHYVTDEVLLQSKSGYYYLGRRRRVVKFVNAERQTEFMWVTSCPTEIVRWMKIPPIK